MSNKTSPTNDEQQVSAFLKTVVETGKIWLLTDEHGCMMLNSEDEDCVPLWPSEALALAWANGDWQSCQAQSVSLDEWFDRWVPGLIDDDLAVVINPDKREMGVVLLPDELAFELQRAQEKN